MTAAQAAPDGLVVVGASLAGLRAVEAARDSGFTGRITLVGAEEHLPYDRTVLSKAFLAPGPLPEVPYLREPASYAAELGVELRLGAPATALDTAGRTVRAGGTDIPYDRLVIATGVRARTLPAAEGRTGVHTLRTLDDARALRSELAAARDVVVVGAGFIGAEVASAARALGARVTMVDAQPAPLVRSVGPELGALVAGLHTAHGTRLRCGVLVERVEGRAGRAERVVLSDGEVLPADLVVVGAGADPATDWCADPALELDGGIVCDQHLATTAPGVWAAGDVARWHNPLLGRSMRLEHWTSAAEQGALAARNALRTDGGAEPCAVLPYFWSDWYGVRIQFLGVPDADGTEVFGDPAGPRFTALYRTGNRLTGVLALDRRGGIARYRQMLRRGATWEQAREFAAAQESRSATQAGDRQWTHR
ncbi:FAD-dependent oxidoreductase [Streptomyces sp. NPDC007369]|uniref:NAD(P)/FAD-dependent oxidoreductase n=1 Tax=Streptomyces sp. NPDC007369 TaxID=3154589 RepID=UPI0033F3EE6C